MKLGFGKTELLKAVKGAALAGGGAVTATGLNGMGVLPDDLFQPPVGPYIVAALAVVINLVRQLIKDNTTLDE
jgi:hypothetical protein